jgi:predicted ATPase/DNA-binding CsgD family transcriptional regulator
MPLTSFVGRGHEIALAASLLRRADVRLLTLTGAGGVGKTRLAIKVSGELADTFADDVCFVALAAVQNAEAVPSAVARIFGIADTGDATQSSTLATALGNAGMLLVLDNFEHVLAAAPFVTDLLVNCPNLKILVTSRTRLRVSGEQVLPVPPLDVPAVEAVDSFEPLSRSAAVQLFVGRAQAAAPTFQLTEANAPLVAEICRRLDGLPLAIELAAAQSGILPPAPLLARIRAQLPLPFSGPRDAPARLQTVRDTVAWSYDLLTAEQQQALRGLGVFAGGFGLEAVGFLSQQLGSGVGADRSLSTTSHNAADWAFAVVASLIDASLLQQETWEPEPRFSMLEAIRGFALERLEESGEEPSIRSAHANWCLALAKRSSITILRPEGQQELRRLEAEHANLLGALDWLERQGDRDRLLRLAAALGRFWYGHGHFEEGRRWLERALVDAEAAAPLPRAQALAELSRLHYLLGDRALGERRLAQSIPVLRDQGDPLSLVSALAWKGWIAIQHGELEVAVQDLEEALRLAPTIAEPVIANSAKGMVLANLGVVAHERGELDEARARHEEALRTRRAYGDILGTAHSLSDLGSVAADQERYAEALAHFRECLALLGELGYPILVVNTLVGSALVASAWGQPERAAHLLGMAEAAREQFSVAVDLPTERAMLARAEASIRAALGNEHLRTAWAAGRDIPLAAAMREVQAIEPPNRTSPFLDSLAVKLSRREKEVLALLVDGRTDREIADVLYISVRTAEGHVARILSKLGVPTRTAAAEVAAAWRDAHPRAPQRDTE